ncbi:acyltransferase family protein [Leptospira interrogans]
MQYRSEIDGLRAVAVAPVVFFHAGLGGFSGGFVGVDVFFVISGYLITSLILHEQRAGTFTLKSFYERRARRILPALFLVVLACLPFAYLWMMPDEMKAFIASALGVLLSASNFVFYAQSGYFDQAAELKPLLHTWSLAVEEQFYIVFPLLLLFLFKYPRRVLLAVLIALFVASFLLAQLGGNLETLHAKAWSWQNLPSWGFYLLPTRAWELLIGAIIAYHHFYSAPARSQPNIVLSNIASVAGLGLIAYSVFAFDERTPFPSIYTLVPTLGAGLVIAFAHRGTITHKLLSLKPVVGLGLISYSVYLWHQPLFAFARLQSLSQPSETVFLALSALAIVLGYLTWHFVEQPFRNRTRIQTKTLIRSSAFAAACVIAFFTVGRLTDGFEDRFPKDEFLLTMPQVEKWRCRRDKDDDLSKACQFGQGTPNVALIGDSHAGSLAPVLGQALSQKGLSVVALHVAGCAPVRYFLREMTGDRCRQQDDIYDYLKKTPSIEYVVIAARWATKFEISRFDNGEGGIELGSPTVFYPDVERAGREITLAEAISEGVHELLDSGKTVILVYPVPEAGWDVPNYMAKLKMRGALKHDISSSYDVYKSRNASALAALDGAGLNKGLFRVHPEKLFCDTVQKGRCMVSENLKSFYRDTNHLASQGALFVAEQIVQHIAPEPGPSALKIAK